MADVKLITGRNCGWAVRNYAALIEKGVPFETVSAVDVGGNKTEQFRQSTPLELTPVLLHDDVVVFESALINEYIDDSFPEPPLMPADPRGRMQVRKWTYFCEHALIPGITRIARSTEGPGRTNASARYRKYLDRFENAVLNVHWCGPYMLGEQFTLADIVFHTLFVAARDIEHLLGAWTLKPDGPLREWSDNITARPSIKQALVMQQQIPF